MRGRADGTQEEEREGEGGRGGGKQVDEIDSHNTTSSYEEEKGED